MNKTDLIEREVMALVQGAIVAGVTPREVLIELREHWREELQEEAKRVDEYFDKAIRGV